MPSTRASSISRSTVTSFSRAATARNARPARISGPSRARQRRSYSLSRLAPRRSLGERLGQHAGREMAGQQAVVDAAAGRRLDEAGGVADGEDAIGPGPRHRAERQRAQARRRPRLREAVRGAKRRRRTPGTAAPASRSQSRPTRANVVPPAFERHDPGESAGRDLAAEVHLHLIERRKRHFELGAVHEHARHAEAERAVEAIARAAREDGRARFDGDRRRRSC